MPRNASSVANCSMKRKRKYTRRSTRTADNVLSSDVNFKRTNKVIKNTDNNDIIHSKKLAGQSCYNLAESDKTILSDILKGIKPLRKSNFPLLLRMFEQKELSVEQFEKLLSLKVEKSTLDGSNTCKECTNKQLLLEKDSFWQKKYESSNKALKEIEAIAKLHINQYDKPYLEQRTVGIQAVLFTNENVTTSTHDNVPAKGITNNGNSSTELNTKSVNNFSDNNCVNQLDAVEIVPTPSSFKTNEYTISKSGVSSSNPDHLLSPVVLRKPVPPAIPINSTIIDLSNDDETNVRGYYNYSTSTSLDLTSEDLIKISSVFTLAKPLNTVVHDQESSSIQLHPAPLPEIPRQNSSLCESVNLPPAPNLNIQKSTRGTMFLSWDIPATEIPVCTILSYHIFAYHEVSNNTPKTDMWKNIGCVRSLPLPMRCSLLKLQPGEKYYFAVRAVNAYNQIGPFSKIMSHIS
ncbi:Fibronectin type III,Immunoglobulin-like fold [Cinara cedri]|uniref:Fibronectin type III,Immunoglobulin-like fold n=1 Tax=Cinara cedri TaxID=506608 RepID=A0A5E4MZZ1_9HEMI|nr:Fibronectin type III,Immunoglobulin-like fold [Cinara cedri]